MSVVCGLIVLVPGLKSSQAAEIGRGSRHPKTPPGRRGVSALNQGTGGLWPKTLHREVDKPGRRRPAPDQRHGRAALRPE